MTSCFRLFEYFFCLFHRNNSSSQTLKNQIDRSIKLKIFLTLFDLFVEYTSLGLKLYLEREIFILYATHSYQQPQSSYNGSE